MTPKSGKDLILYIEYMGQCLRGAVVGMTE